MKYRLATLLLLVLVSACTNNKGPEYLYSDLMQSSYLDSVASIGELKFQTVDLGAMSDSNEEGTRNVKVLNYDRTLKLNSVGLMGMVNSCSFASDSTIVVGLSTGELALVDHRKLEVLKRFSVGRGPGEFLDPSFVSVKDGVLLVNDVGLMRSTLIDATDLQLLKFLPTRAVPFSITISDGIITYMDAKELEKGFMLVREGIHDSSSTFGERFRMGLAFENLDWTHNRAYNVIAIGDWYLIYSNSIPHLMVFDSEFQLRHVVSFKHDEIRKGFTEGPPDNIQFSAPRSSWKRKVFHGVYSDGSQALVSTVYGFAVLDFDDWTIGTDVSWEFIPKISLETTLEGSEAHLSVMFYVPTHVSMKSSQFMACPFQQDFVDFFEIAEQE